MGTSSSYSAPPSWGDLKGDVTRAAGDGSVSPFKARELVRSFISHNGGSSAMAGGSSGHSRGTVAIGRAARSVARNLGGFISDVGRVGLESALRNAGWADLIDRPVNEILAGLLDRLGGEASTIDDVDARMALSQLQDKYFADAATSDELEEILTTQAHSLNAILQEFFGFYLFEVFCRVFFERLVQRIGEVQAHSFLDEIGDFINSTLANRTASRNISQVDWAGDEGKAMTAEIMESTLNVFGG
ncbi:MAG: hypothetical protein ACLQBD_21580 [Syntrophobacteraceae bacterium]